MTARCTVKKPADSEDIFLVWEYTSPDGMKLECAVLCHQTDVVCDFGEVKGVDCTCDETEITSEATIYPTCMSGVNLSCSNGVTEQKVSFSVKGNVLGKRFLHTPALKASRCSERLCAVCIGLY